MFFDQWPRTLARKLSCVIGKLKLSFGLCGSISLFFVLAAHGAPSNDNFSNATVIGSTPFSASVDTTGATTESTDPIATCSSGNRTPSVWYRFTPSSDGAFKADTFGSNYDTVLSVYTGSPGSFTEVACNDDAGGTVQSQVSFRATAGVTYFFMVTPYTDVGGTLIFELAASQLAPNDNFSNATAISSTPFSSSADTSLANTEGTDPVPTCGNGSTAASVWYQFTPSLNGDITADTFGSNYDTILSAYTGSPGSFTQAACNDDAFDVTSQITFSGTAGVTYFFMVSSSTADGGELSFHISSYSQPPSNDNFSSATVIGSVPFSGSVGTTLATTETADPVPSCGNGSRARSVWYQFTPPSSGTLVADTFTSKYDTILSVYTGSPGSFTPVVCNDNAIGTQSQVAFQATSGTAYYFLITSSSGSGATLNFHLSPASPAPANDNFSNATVISSTPFSNSVNTTGATTELTDPTICGNGSHATSVWYRFTPSSNGTITADTFTSSYDTILAAFTGSPGSFTQVACNDDANNTSQSQVSFTGTAGITYYFMVTSYPGSGGILNFHVNPPQGPANDNFSTATVIGVSPSTSSIDTTLATTEGTDPVPGCGNGSQARSVWYQFTPSSSGIITADTFGSSYDTILSAYTGTPGSFVAVACNDNAAGTLQSQISFQGTAGVTYSFMASSSTGSGGTLMLNLNPKKRRSQLTSE